MLVTFSVYKRRRAKQEKRPRRVGPIMQTPSKNFLTSTCFETLGGSLLRGGGFSNPFFSPRRLKLSSTGHPTKIDRYTVIWVKLRADNL